MPRCRSCDAEIIWSRTENNKPIPLDPEPVHGGNVLLECHGSLARVVAPRDDVKRYISHFVTCPQRNKWRKS